MQYLKEEIKNRIMAAALNEFKEKGFQDASMRIIARNAGVALGNVYRYFKNKDELFNSIMEPVFSQFTSLVLNVAKSDQTVKGSTIVPIKDIIEKVMEVFEKYSTEFIVMMDKSKGSRFENVKEELILLIDNRLKKDLIPQLLENGVEVKDDFITYLMASSSVEGIIIILRKYNDLVSIRYMASQLLILNFNNIIDRFK